MIDSWLTKNIRPIALASILFIFFIVSFLDGNVGQFEVKEIYINHYATFLSLALTFYFSSRGIEKSIKIHKENKLKDSA